MYLKMIKNHVLSNLLYKPHQIPKLMFLVSSCSCLFPIHWTEVLSREWRVGAAPTGDTPTTSEWSANLLSTKVWLVTYIRDLTVLKKKQVFSYAWHHEDITWTKGDLLSIGVLGTNLVKFDSKCNDFNSRKCISKCRLQNGNPFWSGLNGYSWHFLFCFVLSF